MKEINNIFQSQLGLQLLGRGRATRAEIIRNFVQQKNPSRQEITNELIFLKSEWNKDTLSSMWLRKNERSKEDFIEVWPLFTSEYEWMKYNLVSEWLTKAGRSKEDFVTVLPLFTREYEWKKYSLVSDWLTKAERGKEDVDAVLLLFDDGVKKANLALRWLQGQNPETAYSAFLEFANNDIFFNRHSAIDIAEAYSKIPALTNKITNLCKDLYPNNELLQFNLFVECVRETPSQQLTPNIEALKSFIKNLTDDTLALRSLNELKTKINISPLETLEISKGRFSKKYNSIQNILANKTKNDAFNDAASEFLFQKFGAENIPQLEEVSLCDIFSYYDLNNKLGEFRLILKDQFIQELTENFSPSDESPYVSSIEFNKISHLVEGINLPKVSVLGGYLNEVVAPKIAEATLTEEKIDNFTFGNSAVIVANVGNQSSGGGEEESKGGEEESKGGEEESKEDLSHKQLKEFTEKFKQLLRDPDPTVKDVANFFAQGLNIQEKLGYTDQDSIENQDSSKKLQEQRILTNFFRDNKPLVALLFAKEEGFDKFDLVFRSISDGCVANMATQFKSAVYKSLLNDFELVALYSVFNEKISTPILNSGGDHLTGSSTGIDIFTNHFIANNHISPNGLIKALAKEFYNSDLEKKQRQSAEGIITKALVAEYGEEAGKEKFKELRNKVWEDCLEDGEKYDQKLAEVAAYYVLKLTVPALLENRYVSDIKELAELDSAPTTSVIPQDQSPLSARAAESRIAGG